MKESRDKNYCSEILKVTGSRLVSLKLMGKNPMNFQLTCVGIKYVILFPLPSIFIIILPYYLSVGFQRKILFPVVLVKPCN